MRKTYKRLLFFFISLVFVLISGAVGYIVARQEPRIVAVEPTHTVVEAGANDTRIASGASITWTYDYEMCRHNEQVISTADKPLVGLSFSQLQQEYPDVKIVSFDTDAVELEKNLLCYCPLHLILKNDGGVLTVFRTKSGSVEQEKLRDFEIELSNIDEAERKALDTGRVFSDMDEIQRYIYKLLQH